MAKERATNEDARQRVEYMVKLEQRMNAAIKNHPTAVRWTTQPWEKDYALSWFTMIAVYAENDVLIADTVIEDFVNEWGPK
jgi:hypothetical protein